VVPQGGGEGRKSFPPPMGGRPKIMKYVCAFIAMELLRITRQIHCKAVEQRVTLIQRHYNRDWGTSYSRPPIDSYLTSPPVTKSWRRHCPVSGRGQGHVSNFYIVDLHRHLTNFSSESGVTGESVVFGSSCSSCPFHRHQPHFSGSTQFPTHTPVTKSWRRHRAVTGRVDVPICRQVRRSDCRLKPSRHEHR